MDASRQKLIDRILKLLALAGGTSFAAEADSARAMAEELIAKHNVSLDEGKKDRNQFAIEDYTPWAKGAQWEYDIANSIAGLCGCEAYFYGDFAEFCFAGTVANLESLRFILAEVHRQRIKAWLQYKNSHTGSDNLWAFAFSYAKGLSSKIERLLSGATAINTERKRAKIWFETTHTIRREHEYIRGAGSSAAGRDAGGAASLHRGQVGTPAYRIGRPPIARIRKRPG